MSEFSKQWPTSENFGEHARYTKEGLDIIEGQLFLPADSRVHIAYGALATGRKEGSVLAEGEQGTAKSEFGNIVFGEANVTNVQPTDTAETLLGYHRPTDGEYNKGSMKVNPENPTIMLDEIAHLGNTGPLHVLWNGHSFTLPNGEVIDSTNMSLYATANFYDGRRNKELDAAFRSRFGLGVLFGDANEETATKIHSRDLEVKRSGQYRDGILPSSQGRAALANMLGKQFPLHKDIGEYVVRVLSRLNEIDVIRDVNVGDARTSQGWQVASRAQVLVDGGKASKDEISLNKEDFSRVAALALGASVSLSQVGKSRLGNELQTGSRVTTLEAQVTARRLVAAVAYDVAAEMNDYGKISEDKRAEFVGKYAFARHKKNDVIDGFVSDALAPKTAKDEETSDGKKPRGIFRRRSH